MAWQNWFTPHQDTHKKAHLISLEGFIVYILFFIILQVSFSVISYTKPGILGISGNIDQKKLIELTNVEREKAGLSPVVENEALDHAAVLKAQNMFAENYWAHFAPSGKTPWDFILGSGYKFTFAGENLAKNFSESSEVVKAWMASSTHRDNLLNPKYQDIGIAVTEGVLNGQKTILVVQEFGSTSNIAATPTMEVQGKQIEIQKQDYINKPELPFVASTTKQNTKVLLDPYQVYRMAGLLVIVLIATLLALDIWVLRKRGVFRLSSHNIAHMALLSLAAGSLLVANPGSVLGDSIPGTVIIPFSIKKMVLDNFFKTSSTVMNILIIGILIYLIWALFHHKRKKSLTLSIFLEYLLTAILMLILLTGMIF